MRPFQTLSQKQQEHKTNLQSYNENHSKCHKTTTPTKLDLIGFKPFKTLSSQLAKDYTK